MKIALIWFVLSAIISITLIVKVPSYTLTSDKTVDLIKKTNELSLLKDLITLKEINKDILRSKYKELHRGYKQDVINSQIEALPKGIFYLLLISLNIINIIVIISIMLFKYFIRFKNITDEH